MTRAVRMHRTGGPEVLVMENVPMPEPGPTDVLIHHEAIGLNFIDVYFRSGLYKVAELPATIGMEAAGVVRAVGSEVTWLAPGDRVAYATSPIGAYAADRVLSADRVVKLPNGIDFNTGAAMMLCGMTAEYLLRRTYKVKAGDPILVYAAAGGVGLILCQWAKLLGAEVIGVVSTEQKAELARAHGAAHTIIGNDKVTAEVKRITGGSMVPVVYDSIGRDTFMTSLDSLAPLGMMISYGSASGPVPPVDIALLSAKGSLFLTRPSLVSYTATRADLQRSAQALFEVVQSGAMTIEVNQTFALKDAADAHRALEARQTTGSTVLIP
jgi:NADPH2:quinone reductase